MITQTFNAWGSSDYIVDIEPKKSISVVRTETGMKPTKFVVGDEAEYDSYNLKYTGTIVSITEKTVTIQTSRNQRNKRLKIQEFAWRNWNFDAERVARENYEASMYI